MAGFEREVCAEAPPAAAGGGSPPLPSVALTVVEPLDPFGGLLDEQSVTVNLGFHHYAQYSLKSVASGAAAGYVAAQDRTSDWRFSLTALQINFTGKFRNDWRADAQWTVL